MRIDDDRLGRSLGCQQQQAAAVSAARVAEV